MKHYNIGSFNIQEYEEVASTNTFAENIPSKELSDHLVILTWKQKEGRGQANNKWESAPDSNISMTIVFQPEKLEASKQFAISMIIALGCCDFLQRYVPNVSIKWPNDIYVGDKKIAGILIEHRIVSSWIHTSLCGIGININQKKFISNAPNPISLYQLTGKIYSLPQILEKLLECLEKRYLQIHDYSTLENDFLTNLYRSKGIYEWLDAQGRFRASIIGIDEYGQLRLKDENNTERIYAFKEVAYILPNNEEENEIQ